ncbi:hypothetical protein FD823_03265 [Klebsiella pneumoniae]|nr:hypothetical protein [Klebsiella pneumoniae]PXK58348.1 hypothetical protein DMS00_13255 [Klebsiella variicola]PXL66021.1 hypothetical protein DMS63_00520 [Klebsiella variicola]HBX6078861.1 hypothetical protein [Klebsiella pneumoniae]
MPVFLCPSIKIKLQVENALDANLNLLFNSFINNALRCSDKRSAGHVMAEVEMSKHGIRAMVISAVIGLFIWIALISALRGLFL